jgi:hypothetical protein
VPASAANVSAGIGGNLLGVKQLLSETRIFEPQPKALRRRPLSASVRAPRGPGRSVALIVAAARMVRMGSAAAGLGRASG